MQQIVLVAHNIRSCYNVGSLLRTCDGLGAKLIMTGYTPYPRLKNDPRLPHLADKITNQIAKTALGAESSDIWSTAQIDDCIQSLKKSGFLVVALEQTKNAVALPDFVPGPKTALILGEEVLGTAQDVIDNCDSEVVIPMCGKKESFNVASAAAMALYHIKFAHIIKKR